MMQKYIQYVAEFHENNASSILFINNQLKKYLIDNEENQTEIETILDYLYSNPKVDISKIGYKTILSKTEKRHKKLQAVSIKSDETEGVDYDVFLDFGDGFKFVTLKSKSSYEREGKLMSHCVSSYHGRDSVIYSLRDDKNNPHCTIEDGQQIKGKGNGKIDPKYVDYVVKFLEKKGKTVGENEMKNLGYYKLDTIDQGLECEYAYNGYVYENKLDTIQKDGEQYLGFSLLKIKKLVEIKADFSLKFNFDIEAMLKRFNRKISSVVQTANNHSSTAVANDSYSTAVANNHSSTAVANNHSSTAVANDSYSTAVANGKNSIALVRGERSKASGKIGSWLVITERDKKEENIIDIKTYKVDGESIKEDTFYCVVSGLIVERVDSN